MRNEDAEGNFFTKLESLFLDALKRGGTSKVDFNKFLEHNFLKPEEK